MKEVIIERISVADIDSLLALGIKTYSETFGPHNTKENLDAYLNKAFDSEKLLEELKDPNSEFYFALFKNEKAGYLKVNFGSAQTELQDEKAMEIERIYVLQKFQGNNIGKSLLEKAIAIAREYKLDYIWLGVWEKNTKALLFYQKYGFTQFSQHSFFVGDDKQTDWMMKLMLKESVKETELKNE